LQSSNQDLIRQVESSDEPARPAQGPKLVIMPGAFHAQYPHTGADGRFVREMALGLGWETECVPVPSLGKMDRNADALLDFLSRSGGGAKIVVSLSKGSADVRAMLERPGAAEALRDVKAWLSFSGMFFGTPLVAWLRARPLRLLGVRLLFLSRGQRFAAVDELGHGANLAKPAAPISGPRPIHLLGFPLRRHLSDDWAKRGYERLAPLGPNDGGGILLADALRLPGEVYPVWGADHYMRPGWDFRPLLRRLLIAAADSSRARY
jgi:hypothetical protein